MAAEFGVGPKQEKLSIWVTTTSREGAETFTVEFDMSGSSFTVDEGGASIAEVRELKVFLTHV